MPATVIVASMLLMLVSVKAPEASQSCMSGTEARQHFGSSHIYWRGQDHCQDATPGARRHQILDFQQAYPVSQVGRKVDQPGWQVSMPGMLAGDQETARGPWADRWVDIETPLSSIVAQPASKLEQKPPPSIIERKSEPILAPRAVVLVFVAFILALTLATIELLFRGMIHERPDR